MEPHPHHVTEQELKDEQLVGLELNLLQLVLEWPLELQVVEAQGG